MEGDRSGRLVLGTAALGLQYGLPRASGSETLDDESAVAVLRSAVDRGVCRVDTAPAYGDSERRVGIALASRGIVWTKVGRIDQGLDGLLRAFDASCERLQRERIDVVQWHNWTPTKAQDPVFRNLWKRLEADGRVGALGATTYGPGDALEAVESGLFALVQVEWNLLNQRVVDRIGEAASSRGVSVATRSVLLQGALTDDARVLPPVERLHAGVARARELARRLGMSLTALALRAALDHPHITYVLFGADRVQQIDDALHIARRPALPGACNAELKKLDLHGDPASDPRSWPTAT